MSSMLRRIWCAILLPGILLLSACEFLPQVLETPASSPPIILNVPLSDLTPPPTLEIPQYDGRDSIELNGNRPVFSLEELYAAPHVTFSAFDDLGRTGPGFALLGPELLPTESRGQIGDIRPSGWHTARYDDLIEDHFLFNRCHVIAYMYCGDNATPENLFTGTRYLNTESMLNYELQVLRYLHNTGNHVAYRVTPTYAGKNLVAAGVQMEAYSVEDRGKGICFNVFVYNIQPGIIIDYRTGESRRDPDYHAVLPRDTETP